MPARHRAPEVVRLADVRHATRGVEAMRAALAAGEALERAMGSGLVVVDAGDTPFEGSCSNVHGQHWCDVVRALWDSTLSSPMERAFGVGLAMESSGRHGLRVTVAKSRALVGRSSSFHPRRKNSTWTNVDASGPVNAFLNRSGEAFLTFVRMTDHSYIIASVDGGEDYNVPVPPSAFVLMEGHTFVGTVQDHAGMAVAVHSVWVLGEGGAPGIRYTVGARPSDCISVPVGQGAGRLVAQRGGGGGGCRCRDVPAADARRPPICSAAGRLHQWGGLLMRSSSWSPGR